MSGRGTSTWQLRCGDRGGYLRNDAGWCLDLDGVGNRKHRFFSRRLLCWGFFSRRLFDRWFIDGRRALAQLVFGHFPRAVFSRIRAANFLPLAINQFKFEGCDCPRFRDFAGITEGCNGFPFALNRLGWRITDRNWALRYFVFRHVASVVLGIVGSMSDPLLQVVMPLKGDRLCDALLCQCLRIAVSINFFPFPVLNNWIRFTS